MASPLPRGNVGTSSHATDRPPPPAIAGFGRRLASLARARWPQVTIFLFALAVVDLIRNYSFLAQPLGTLIGEEVLLIVLGIAFGIGGASVAGTMAAEALPLRGVARAIATVIFALAGAGFAMAAIALWWPGRLLPETVGTRISTSAFVLRNLWYYSAMSVLLAAYFATRDRDAVIAHAAQAAELERAGVRRAVLESRLKVMQARVEPEILFDVLGDVQRLYASTPQDAEALLDDLIVYLRAALPQMRGDASTLGREAALAQAFLKVTQPGRDGSSACVNRIAPDLADLPFPPMVLLPLVHAAADARAARVVFDASGHAGEGTASVSIVVTVAVPSGIEVPGWQSERLSALREIVGTYFGEGTRLDAMSRNDGITVAITFRLPRSLVPPYAEPGQDAVPLEARPTTRST